MSKQVILFGHFAAPLHDDPWTGQIHNITPEQCFHDQLQRLIKTSYAANSASRVLEYSGRILKIVNNFQYLNFSFNPVLLGHLKQEAPNVFSRIVNGDRWAQEVHNGHGSALAQPYHHAILPLCQPWEAKMLIEWGLEAFQTQFGRPSEGFWLPHGALTPAIADLLLQEGVRFILLSTDQVEATSLIGSGEWDWIKSPLNTQKPYRIQRPGGNLDVIFSHSSLSKGLTNYLKDSEILYQALKQEKVPENEESLLLLATPGETFGWAEPYGDMCLASLWDRIQQRGEMQLGNLGEFLEKTEPKLLVKMKKGESELGTSNNNPRGVVHWHGPSSFNSAEQTNGIVDWRPKMWETINRLKNQAARVISSEIKELSSTPYENLIQDYLAVLAGATSPHLYCNTNLRPHLINTGSSALLSLLQALFTLPRMSSSYAWEPGPPEQENTVEALLYGIKVIELLSPFVQEDWETQFRMGILSAIPEDPTKEGFFEKVLLPRRRSPEFPAALFVMDAILRSSASYAETIGVFTLESFTRRKTRHSDLLVEFSGQLHMQETDILASMAYEYLLVEDMQEGISLHLKSLNSSDALPQAFDLQTLPLGEREEVVNLMNTDLESTLAEATEMLMPKLKKAMIYSKLLGTRRPETIKAVLEIGMTRHFQNLFPEMGLWLSDQQLENLEKQLNFAKEHGLKLNQSILDQKFSKLLAKALHTSQRFQEESTVNYTEKLLLFTRRWKIEADLTVAQALVFESLGKESKKLTPLVTLSEIEVGKMRNLLKISTLLGINTDTVREKLFVLT